MRRLLVAFAGVLVLGGIVQATPAWGASFAIDDVTVTEGNAGTVNATFTVTLSDAVVGESYTVDAATQDGTAVATSDYDALSPNPTTLNFPVVSGTTATHDVTVVVNADAVDEIDETFEVVLSNATSTDLGEPVPAIGDATGVGTINDDDGPTVSIAAISPTRGEGSGAAATFTVSLSAPSPQDVKVTYASTGGTATAGSDYTGVGPLQLTFPANSSASQDISITLFDDTLDEGSTDETIVVTLSSPVDATIGTASASVGIVDNDTTAFTISDVSVTEGTNPTATFVVHRDRDASRTVSVTATTANGTALAGSDYTATGPTVLSFNPGDGLDANFTVPITNDLLDENQETFLALLSAASADTTISDGSGTGSINDNDDPPTVSINDRTVAEGNAGSAVVAFTVSLSGASGLPISVEYSTSGGTATGGGDDYVTVTNAVVNIPAGQTSAAANVTVNGDAFFEATETANVTLSNPVNAGLGAANPGTLTITNDDAVPVLTITGVTVGEADGTASLTVTRSGFTHLAATAAYATANGTAAAGSDYTAASGTATVNADLAVTATTTITVPITSDALFEGATAETFTVTLTTPGNAQFPAGAASTAATVSITDDDAPPSIAIGTVLPVAENVVGGIVNIPVALSSVSGLPASFTATTANVTATSGADYTALVAAPFVIPAGSTSVNVPVTILDETIFEAAETFNVSIASPVNATLGAPTSATATINNDDPIPTLTLADNLAMAEGGTTNAFGYSLSNPSAFAIFLTATTANGPAPNATAPADYTALAGSSVAISALTTVGTIPVSIADDALDEDAEQLTLTVVNNASQVTIGDGSALGRITDNDPEPALNIDEVFKTEGNSGTSNATLTVTLTPVSGRAVAVSYATGLSGVGADAEEGFDYSARSGTLNFAPGETIKTIDVPVIGDTDIEGSETIGVTLSSPINATLPNPVGPPPANTGLIVIVDDDELNSPPVAGDDAIVTARNTTGTVNVLTNDIDSNTNPVLLVTDFSAAAHGTAFCTALGVCTYIPATGYLGPDSFTYTVSDGQATDVATVNVTVFRPNSAPVANTDVLKTVGSFPTVVNVNTNDTDAQGDALTFSLLQAPAHGTASCTAAGRCVYRPTAGYLGADSFRYRATDIDGLTGDGTVTVSVVRRKPLRLAARADLTRVKTGRRDGYLVTISNPNPVALNVTSVAACLPARFKYVSRSTRGALRVNPRATSCGRNRTRLTWTRRVTIPAGGKQTFRFKVTTAGVGRVRIGLSGRAQTGFAVTPTRPIAPINVTR